ncbi:hypothetical protein D302_gp152 [Campylobacter phage CP30A]|uniref:Uncharacterized protein n=1 Tax=Campylobacter phage CP30A TaxID=1229752 RepID=J9SUE8_9CAUD|nr:hypothetical protein D302_gp152 [Campylobacter phage CP30A]AFR52464.1 hypothetical protein [Campylobacter phage CP30A]
MYHYRAFRPYIHHYIKMEEYMQSYDINKQVEKLVDIVNNKNIKSFKSTFNIDETSQEPYEIEIIVSNKKTCKKSFGQAICSFLNFGVITQTCNTKDVK